MFSFLTLDWKGVLVALALGIGLFFFGGAQGAFFLLVMLWFLILSGIVTWIGIKRKSAIGVYERSRSYSNVIANGIIPLLIVVFYYFNATANLVPQGFLLVSYVASVAAITADKFSSEIGVLGGRPWMLLTMRKVKQGTSGAVTAFGFGAGLLGSLLIGISLSSTINYGFLLVVVMISGLLGNIVDSILGFFEEKGIGNKFTSNFACSFAGWGASMILLIVLGIKPF
ncbi:MAG: DUF92 domain-containing protein [Candidatus Micrarchaeota archaeon]|nr:DUF92 domain-containing protein [Candidatus Micrarchaeota archaeon]